MTTAAGGGLCELPLGRAWAASVGRWGGLVNWAMCQLAGISAICSKRLMQKRSPILFTA